MLHWLHLKGFNGSDTNSICYTYIEFAEKQANWTASNLYLPKIYINQNNLNTTPSSVYLGRLVASGVDNNFTANQTINGKVIATNSMWATAWYLDITGTSTIDTPRIQNNPYEGSIELRAEAVDIQGKRNGSYYDIYTFGWESFQLGTSSFGVTGVVKGVLNVQATSGGDYTGAVHAVYFNATSDRRAKEELHQLPHNMLDLVNRMQVYTYQYKDSKQKSLGLIAQDLLDIDLDGFSLVDNKNASGENGDYMSIHESKLVYILLGAVQELSQEVQQLKKELGK